MSQVQEVMFKPCDVISPTFPRASTAWTWRVWRPGPRPDNDSGGVQGENAAPSRLQRNCTASFPTALKSKFDAFGNTIVPGASVISTSGPTVSTVQV